MRTDRAPSSPLLAALFALGAACGGDDTQVAPAGGAAAAGAASSAGGAAGSAAAAGKGGSGAGGVAGAPVAPAPCNERCGRTECPCPKGEMISHTWMPPNQATKSWRIDKTEVTKASYAAFLAASPKDPAGWPDFCQERPRKGFVPALTEAEILDCHWDLSAYPNEPIQCVDWCDAHAYCAWAGKRLCGGTVVGSDPAFVYEWIVPCGGPTYAKYPYGASFQPGACNIPEKSDQFGAAKDVGSFPMCTSPAGEVDMIGNVGEWVNRCGPDADAGGATGCARVGGDFFSGQGRNCQSLVGVADPLEIYSQFGIRCCADAN